MANILVTGASGMVASELIPLLQNLHGFDNVVATYGSRKPEFGVKALIQHDIRNKDELVKIVNTYDIQEIYHLASLLSVGGEEDPQGAWDTNLGGLKNVLDVAREKNIKVFWPSSIAAFGPTTPRENTPQHTILEPQTMYGVTKVAGELLCQYYHKKYGVDVRSIRYPGLIGYKAEPGNGTTEYSVHMFYAALKTGSYECYLKEDSRLPMMYLMDAVQATIDIMNAPAEKITVRMGYNLASLSFTPKELAEEINKHIPLAVTYNPDFRQAIADSWPQTVDDSTARSDWEFSPKVGLKELVEIMLTEIKKKLGL